MYKPFFQDDQENLWIGKIKHEGILTNHDAFIPINNFMQSCVLYGKSGSGQTYFLAFLINQIRKKAPNVTILIIKINMEVTLKVFYCQIKQTRKKKLLIKY